MPAIGVTGATGFIGRRVVAALLESFEETRIRLLVRDAGRRAAFPDPAGRIETVPGSLDDRDALQSLVADTDAVVHLAGAIAGNDAAAFDAVNVGGTRRLAEALADRAPDTHLILVSSLAARKPGLSWYAASKRRAEEVVQTRARHWSILRPPAVYGREDRALAPFWRALARGWLIRLGPAAARFSLIGVEDMAEAIRRLTATGPTGKCMPLAGPEPDGGWSWPALAALASRLRGAPVRTLTLPSPLLRMLGHAAPLAGRLTGRPAMLNPGKVRELHHADWVCDNLALEAVLGWRPQRALEQSLPTLPGWSPR